MNAEEMFQEEILDNYRNPKNFGIMENPDIIFRDSNPACGDVIEMNIKVSRKTIKDIRFNGKGCAISIASASLLTDYAKSKNLNDITNLKGGDLLNMLGINLSPIRVKCALLSLKVLKFAVCNHLGKTMEEDYDN